MRLRWSRKPVGAIGLWVVLTAAMPLAAAAEDSEPKPRGEPAAVVRARAGLPGLRAKLATAEPLTIAYLGGSLTELAVWNNHVAQTLRPGDGHPESVREVNAGVSGTGSVVGVLRVDQDVLSHGPDLVVVEFAVNDIVETRQGAARSMEGIVRKIRSAAPGADILFVYLFDPRFQKALARGELPTSIRAHEEVAEHYGIPSIEVATPIAELAREGRLALRGPDETPAGAPPAFAHDGVHPHSYGRRLYAGLVAQALAELLASSDSGPTPPATPGPLYEDHFAAGRRISFSHLRPGEGWRRVESAPGTTAARLGIELWEASGVDARPVEFGFRGQTLKFYEERSRDPGGIEIRVDGELLASGSVRALTPGPRLRLLHVRHSFDPDVEHRISLRVVPPKDAPGDSRTVRFGDLLMEGEVRP